LPHWKTSFPFCVRDAEIKNYQLSHFNGAFCGVCPLAVKYFVFCQQTKNEVLKLRQVFLVEKSREQDRGHIYSCNLNGCAGKKNLLEKRRERKKQRKLSSPLVLKLTLKSQQKKKNHRFSNYQIKLKCKIFPSDSNLVLSFSGVMYKSITQLLGQGNIFSCGTNVSARCSLIVQATVEAVRS